VLIANEGGVCRSEPRLSSSYALIVAAEPIEAGWFGNRAVALEVVFAADERRGPTPARLSHRERAVARLLVAGYSYVNIAAIIGIGRTTIRTYMRRIYAKLGVFNRADLVRELLQASALVNQLRAYNIA